MRPPRKLESETELYDAAIRALMRRAHSVHEMRKSLERRAASKEMVKSVLDRLKRQNLLDDARYAQQFTRQRIQIRRQGKFRIARDLRTRGVPDRHIEAALAAATTPEDETALVRKRIERKLKSLGGVIDQRKIASLYGSLLRLGFPSEIIRREIRAMTREEVLEIADTSEEPA